MMATGTLRKEKPRDTKEATVTAFRLHLTVLGEASQFQLRGIVEHAGTKETVPIRRALVPPAVANES